MEQVTLDTNKSPVESNAQNVRSESPQIDYNHVLDLAKRRMEVRRGLFGQTLDYLLIIGSAITFCFLPNIQLRGIFALILCLFWGIRLFHRAFKFMKPALKDGLVIYFRNRRAQQLALEYDRLKKMGENYISEELDK